MTLALTFCAVVALALIVAVIRDSISDHHARVARMEWLEAENDKLRREVGQVAARAKRHQSKSARWHNGLQRRIDKLMENSRQEQAFVEGLQRQIADLETANHDLSSDLVDAVREIVALRMEAAGL